MKQTADLGVYKPRPSQTEAKSDAITKTARRIIDAEAAMRTAKMELLRAARLSHELTKEPTKITEKYRRK